MIAHAVRMKRMKRGESYIAPLGSETGPSVLMERCNLLFVASGVFFIVGSIVMIPGFFGDTNFFIYSASSFGIGLVVLVFACLCNALVYKDDEHGGRSGDHRATTNTGTTDSPPGVTDSPNTTRILEVSTFQPEV